MTEFSILMQKYLQETLSVSEFERFRVLLQDPQNQLLLNNSLEEALENQSYADFTADMDEDQLYQKIEAAQQVVMMPISSRNAFIQKWRWMAAAIIGVITVSAAYFFISERPTSQPDVAATSTNTAFPDVEPGKESAILTLSDGSQVILDSLKSGLIASQNGTSIVLKDGRLAYSPMEETNNSVVVEYNTMFTPKGRQFQVALPDGTQVWLNAASSIRYPTVFKGKTRNVEITGEVYFEVAQNATMPFIVNVNNAAQVQVLGTHFNVNAYQNEGSINATLLDGSIQVRSLLSRGNTKGASVSLDNKSVILAPGQQAQITNDTPPEANIRVTNNIDTDKVMAWKSGTFNFEGISLEAAMRQLERWYGIEVRYENGVPPIRFIGKIKNNVSLHTMLKILEKSGVHSRLLEERLLIVTQ